MCDILKISVKSDIFHAGTIKNGKKMLRIDDAVVHWLDRYEVHISYYAEIFGDNYSNYHISMKLPEDISTLFCLMFPIQLI
jgi:hypothetical protein